MRGTSTNPRNIFRNKKHPQHGAGSEIRRANERSLLGLGRRNLPGRHVALDQDGADELGGGNPVDLGRPTDEVPGIVQAVGHEDGVLALISSDLGPDSVSEEDRLPAYEVEGRDLEPSRVVLLAFSKGKHVFLLREMLESSSLGFIQPPERDAVILHDLLLG